MSANPPDISQLVPPQPAPDVSSISSPAPTPVLAGSPGSPQYAAAQNQPPSPSPILYQLIKGLTHPQMVAPAPGEQARPVSRLSTFENFLGNFVNALGQGLSAAHGPGAFGKGFGAAVTAPYQQDLQRFQLGQEAQANQARVGQEQAQTALTQQQARLAGQMATVNIPGLGAVTAPVSQLGNILKGSGAAAISGQSRMSVAQFQAMLGLGQVGKIETGTNGERVAYNKYGQPLGALDGAVDPRFLPTQNKTQQWLETSPGVWQLVDKTSTSSKVPQGGAPSPAGGTNIPKPKGAGGASGGSAPAGNGRTIYGGQVGVAFDPKTNEYVQTTPRDAQANGYQQFQKVTAKESEDNRQLNNRLADVAQKITRYEDSISQPLSSGDQQLIAGLLASDKFKAGLFGAEISVDRLNQLLNQENIEGLSEGGKKALLAYSNAREAMTGYQRVLSGSGRSSDKNLELNLETLPSPVMPPDYIKEGIRQFKENVNIAGQGLPRMMGITRAKDIFANEEQIPVQIPGQGPGTIKRGRLAEFQKKYPAARVLQ